MRFENIQNQFLQFILISNHAFNDIKQYVKLSPEVTISKILQWASTTVQTFGTSEEFTLS